MCVNIPQKTNVWFKCFMLEAPIESVKVHVVEEMSKSESNIHFGPSNSIEALVQETGRLGRDGKQLQCVSYILYQDHCPLFN